ncbi:protein kinase domain-containing protein [Dyadobacter sandarakinus]|uniref:Protein kinase n=1 Tax=Dyadobacter sandarakinus TaxID=2747268 RepID=A0ABX7I5X3_9BACT|nr:protein kinase [Dyadobacter sandarakinus]QRR01501.1 protein kinase [Dyadobacter sandarakinus]
MSFTFPDNATIVNGALKNFGPRNTFVDINTLVPQDNLIEINGISYYYTYLGSTSGNKGGNSIILKLYESQFFDTDDIEYGEPERILKISKSKITKFPNNSEKRFTKEIDALKRCNEKSFQNVINIFQSGVCRILNQWRNGYDQHQFYTMEFAQADLKSYIEQNNREMGTDEKIRLCLSLCEGLKELYTVGYYHRDIKPDNIFIIGSEWKIGDLGLISERDGVEEVDRIADFIGPKGWMSPEAMNKYLCEGKGFRYKHNCCIDHQSDIFQLGKVFWYIFQHNAPIGSVKESDFQVRNSVIYSILKTMLSHSKSKRYKNIDEIIKLLKTCEVKAFRQLVA